MPDFARITNPALFVRWMEEHFPDAVPLIGERTLADMWDKNPRGALITVKVNGTLSLFVLVRLIEFILRQHHIIIKTAVSSSGMQRTRRFRSTAKGSTVGWKTSGF